MSLLLLAQKEMRPCAFVQSETSCVPYSVRTGLRQGWQESLPVSWGIGSVCSHGSRWRCSVGLRLRWGPPIRCFSPALPLAPAGFPVCRAVGASAPGALVGNSVDPSVNSCAHLGAELSPSPLWQLRAFCWTCEEYDAICPSAALYLWRWGDPVMSNEPFYVSPFAFSFLQYGIPEMKQVLF